MAWTDDRVERLTQLWNEGLSASQIATDLGGVTRNAVIGKVHRLGMSGRTRPAKPAAASKPRAKPAARAAKPAAKAAKPITARARKPISAPKSLDPVARKTPAQAKESVKETAKTESGRPSRARNMPSAPRLPKAVSGPEGRAFAPPSDALRMDDGNFATVMTITDHMCKWPLGDPGAEDFRFCGRRTDPEEPYCVAHNRVAYQPSRRKGVPTKNLPPVLRRKAIR